MTFEGHIVPFVASVVTFSPERNESANVTTRATNKQYDPTKVVLLTLSPIYKYGLINGYECDMGFNIASEA